MIVTTTEAAVLTAQSSSNNKAQTADVKKMSPQFVRANTTQMPAKPKSYLNGKYNFLLSCMRGSTNN